jgi:nicotinate-nucleotide adenylyltransferase
MRNQRIGLYFGSFNPVHVGHLIIANYILNETSITSLWFIVSPQNPLKTSSSLLNIYDRYYLLQLATEDDPRIKVSNIEFNLPQPSYTINTLTYLQEKHPGVEFVVIMGSDSFQNLPKWKNYEAIVKNYEIIIYKRPGFEVNNELDARIHVVDAPLLDISSTEIRKMIKEGKSIRYLVPEKVHEEIDRGRFFKK